MRVTLQRWRQGVYTGRGRARCRLQLGDLALEPTQRRKNLAGLDLAVLLDIERRNRRREDSEEPDAEEHQADGNEPAGNRGWAQVAVPDGRHRDHRPPDAVPQAVK